MAKHSSATKTIDLHGMTVEEAIAAVDRGLNDSIQSENIYRLEIIHGIGKGILKKAVSKYLAKIGVIESYYLDPKNQGTTWVKL